jgi:hypothetical protein
MDVAQERLRATRDHLNDTFVLVRFSRLALTRANVALFRSRPHVKDGEPARRRPYTQLRGAFPRRRRDASALDLAHDRQMRWQGRAQTYVVGQFVGASQESRGRQRRHRQGSGVALAAVIRVGGDGCPGSYSVRHQPALSWASVGTTAHLLNQLSHARGCLTRPPPHPTGAAAAG